MMISPLSLHFLQNHPKDSVRTLEQFAPDEIASILELLTADAAANILRQMIPSITVSCLSVMDPVKSANILEKFSIERTSMFLRRLNPDDRNRIIKSLTPVYANRVRLVMKFPSGTVGQVMNPNVFTVLPDKYVGDVIKAVQDSHDMVRSEIFIIDEKQRLKGHIFIRDLLVADHMVQVNKIMQEPDRAIPARANLESVKDYSQWKYKDTLPVVDHMNIFIGVLKRGVMLDAIARDYDANEERDEFLTTAMAIAEVFWDACANMISPDYDYNPKRQKDERDQ